MRHIIISLAAAFMAAVALPAVSAVAATPKAPPVDPASKKKGMESAPGLIQSAGLDCQLVDARFMGQQKDDKAKTSTDYYEIACKDAEGFVVSTKTGGPPDTFTCLEAAGSKGASCTLPENLDPKAPLGAILAKTGVNCAEKDARGIGHTQDGKETVFEVACQDGSGYLLHTSYPVSANKPARVEPCLALALANAGMQCTLSSPEAQNAAFAALVTQSGKNCQLKDKRFVGISQEGNQFVYEVSCADGKGYVLFQAPNGGLAKTVDCGNTDMCTLTDTRVAETQQLDLYSRLAHSAGYACDVSKYARFDVNVPGHEVVELQCKNRPDGAVAIFPASSKDPSQVYDCAHAELVGYRCQFTQVSAADPNLTADLKKLGKTSCAVADSRIVGKTSDTVGYIEVSCADGNPGFLISYTLPAMTPKEAIACSFAKDIVGGCKMPANSKRG